jgi:outer membrane receptor protein involved in Fe transport
MLVPNLSAGVLSISGRIARVIIAPVSAGDTAVASHVALTPYRMQGFLFAVDGVALLDTANFERVMDRLEVDSVVVLRGADATSRYGTLASRGVVRIVTRKRP